MYLEAEHSIIEKALAGDINCFEKIVTAYEKMVYSICYRYFNNEEDAKDIAQEVFIKIYKNLKKYNFKCKFSTWAYRITVNCCIDGIRKKKSRPQTDSIDDSLLNLQNISATPADAVILKESIKDLEGAINSLPDQHKTFILLRDLNGLSYQEISEITDTNLNTVKTKILRARQYLKHTVIAMRKEDA